jgi:hypothetical protein
MGSKVGRETGDTPAATANRIAHATTATAASTANQAARQS